MGNKWTVVDALRHSRHDWLNRLQLVKANLSLGRPERVHELIEEFVREAQHEAKLISLQMPRFAELLLTYSWEHPPCSLEYEVLGDIHTRKHLDEQLYGWAKQFLFLLHESVHPAAENHISVTVECGEQNVRFFFDFRGRLSNMQILQDWLAAGHGAFALQYSLHEEELSIELAEQ
ncbi:sporulation initiation phosphotransferase B [Ectobacillus ponti]|uniref:Sporulation initiation phosphotransferase B n=1 Tax=Ectobacillus ponti TaxID=2961894 RepID=A0AA41X5P0_9BACI|nr:sporulation initiation phosphotransferase B [Ectobacillus ponti]MCP8967310.1 sporulation initiation phosphotransferase B [Ectobacillus ponti]